MVRASDELVTVDTADKPAARTTSSADYLVDEIKRHKRGAALAAAAVLVAVAALAYFFYPRSGGEAIDSVAVLPFDWPQRKT